jgi:hypothetical protein
VSQKVPSKTQFSDSYRRKASCKDAVTQDPTLVTAWDNVDVGTWKETVTVPDPQAETAKFICYACPVRRQCIEDALSDNEAEGLRGGYRFESGMLSKEDARKLLKEFSLRAKVRKAERVNVYIPNQSDQAVSGVQSND